MLKKCSPTFGLCRGGRPSQQLSGYLLSVGQIHPRFPLGSGSLTPFAVMRAVSSLASVHRVPVQMGARACAEGSLLRALAWQAAPSACLLPLGRAVDGP